MPNKKLSLRTLSSLQACKYSVGAVGMFMLMTLSTACTAHGSAGTTGFAFSCDVSGLKSPGVALDRAAICTAIKSKVDALLPHKTVNGAANAQGDRIQVDVRYEKSGSLVAAVNEKRGAQTFRYPEISIDVLDRPIAQQDVNMLAAEVAKAIAERQKQTWPKGQKNS